MKWGICLFVLGSLVGCHGSMQSPQAPLTYEGSARTYEGSASPALVFDPPLIADAAPLNLSRAGREPSVFMGYEDLTTNFIYQRTDDRQTNDGTNFYLRQTIMERVGVTYR